MTVKTLPLCDPGRCAPMAHKPPKPEQECKTKLFEPRQVRVGSGMQGYKEKLKASLESCRAAEARGNLRNCGTWEPEGVQGSTMSTQQKVWGLGVRV